ncbi:cytochrome oxidase complex assembly protein [Drechmeria coniospora]|uniref:Cytochrome oxidase complex assembly protein n=1 Tax=Drechmeria coniospora TaxID=98403 RepID=A0A151GXA6_DRECN|nr:cytochrome oxidase complex assembly protein [Drechmeria coniospora]KYK61736.1 cytochrome oxidase complex assembly protein [Drechmeria coniospora]ODA82540.1 hypothetical protein RJ55_01047 [Drechmeria coniospora]
MLSRAIQRRLEASLPRCKPHAPSSSRGTGQRRWLTPAPKKGDGPLMSRRADRELPDIKQVRFRWGRSLPLFLGIVALSSLAIFNYQKSSSPIVSSTLYALRTSPRARALLGDDIYFKHQIPWIRGEMNQLQGRINIYFTVRGNRASATMRFASHRPSSRSLFETTEWSLTMDGSGERIDLLDGRDPFRGLLGDDAASLPELDEEHGPSSASTRGFRQQGALNK